VGRAAEAVSIWQFAERIFMAKASTPPPSKILEICYKNKNPHPIRREAPFFFFVFGQI